MSLSLPLYRAILVTICIIGATAFGATRVAAQQTFDLPIAVYTCPTDPGDVSLNVDNIPDDCDPIDGVGVSVALEDGTAVGSCTTGTANPGLCKVAVPNPSTVVVTEDDSALPDDEPRENPLTVQIASEFSEALFINLPKSVDTLPDTGIGSADRALLPGGVTAVSGLLMLIGLGMSVILSIASWRYGGMTISKE